MCTDFFYRCRVKKSKEKSETKWHYVLEWKSRIARLVQHKMLCICWSGRDFLFLILLSLVIYTLFTLIYDLLRFLNNFEYICNYLKNSLAWRTPFHSALINCDSVMSKHCASQVWMKNSVCSYFRWCWFFFFALSRASSKNVDADTQKTMLGAYSNARAFFPSHSKAFM